MLGVNQLQSATVDNNTRGEENRTGYHIIKRKYEERKTPKERGFFHSPKRRMPSFDFDRYAVLDKTYRFKEEFFLYNLFLKYNL